MAHVSGASNSAQDGERDNDETERSNESRITVLETRFDDIVPTLATRSDLKELGARFDAIVPTLATKADLERLRAEIANAMVKMQRWMITTMVAIILSNATTL